MFKINYVNLLEKSELFKIIINMKRTTKNFTQFRFNKNLKNHINF